MAEFSFKVLKKDSKSKSRTGVIKTRNGNIKTPNFVTVATGAAVRGLDSKDLKKIKIPCAIVNTYHLHFMNSGSSKSMDEVIKKKGGAHKVMGYDGVLLSDSGGFQIFSLGHELHGGINKLGSKGKDSKRHENFVKMNDKGAEFVSVYDGKKKFMGPKESMKIQSNIGADIIMSFDECPSPLDDYEYNKKSLEKTHKWELESLKYHDKKQAIYGIIQGGPFKDLRLKSAEFVNSNGFDGVAIGGVFGPEGEMGNMHEVLDWIIPVLDDRPRHLLGIGEVVDIFECVERGVDTFDCVMPTRVARHGMLLVSPKSGGSVKNKFRRKIGNSEFKNDKKVIDKTCNCYVCKNGVSRSKLRELFKAKDPEYVRLATIHNLSFMYNLMKEIRESIEKGNFDKLKKKWL